MESIAVWQGATLGGIVAWILISSYLNVTRKLRSFLQPWVAHHVIAGTPLSFQIQKYQHWFFDALFSGLSCVVSVPFYTAFLPLLFWSGHGRLARQMTLLMAFCDYLGNTIKDVVSAPRPSSPPVRRITATKDEEDNALECGLPSSHTLNTVCLSGGFQTLTGKTITLEVESSDTIDNVKAKIPNSRKVSHQTNKGLSLQESNLKIEGRWLITMSKRTLLCTLSFAFAVVSNIGWL